MCVTSSHDFHEIPALEPAPQVSDMNLKTFSIWQSSISEVGSVGGSGDLDFDLFAVNFDGATCEPPMYNARNDPDAVEQLQGEWVVENVASDMAQVDEIAGAILLDDACAIVFGLKLGEARQTPLTRLLVHDRHIAHHEDVPQLGPVRPIDDDHTITFSQSCARSDERLAAQRGMLRVVEGGDVLHGGDCASSVGGVQREGELNFSTPFMILAAGNERGGG